MIKSLLVLSLLFAPLAGFASPEHSATKPLVYKNVEPIAKILADNPKLLNQLSAVSLAEGIIAKVDQIEIEFSEWVGPDTVDCSYSILARTNFNFPGHKKFIYRDGGSEEGFCASLSDYLKTHYGEPQT